MSPAEKPPRALELRRIGIDTHQHSVICMRSDCHGCRSEGLGAETHGLVRNGNRGILSTMNVVTSDLLDPGETAIAARIRGDVERPVVIGPDEVSAQWVRAVALATEAPHAVLHAVRTLVAAVRHPSAAGLAPPFCIGVRAIFAGDACESLVAAGAARVVTCNTTPHASSAIDVVAALAAPVRMRLAHGSPGMED